MNIDPTQIRFIDPLEVYVRSDGVKLYVVGYSDQFEGQPVAATEPNPDASSFRLLGQFLKFSQPEA